jgi:hypothetical protein
MPRGPCDFKLNNVVQAKRAAEKAGIRIGALEIDSNGTIRIVPKDAESSSDPRNDLDKWLRLRG